MFEVNIAKILYVIISILIPSFSVAQSGTFTTTVTVRGTVYELENYYGKYDDNKSVMMAQPWWGDEALAFDFSVAAQGDLGLRDGTPSVAGSNSHALFSFEPFANHHGVGSQTRYIYSVGQTNPAKGWYRGGVDWNYAILSASSSSTDNRGGLRPVKYTLAPDLIPSNVPTCSGSKFVSGFQILGGGKITWYVESRYASECFNGNVIVLPEGVSAKDMTEVLAYLGNPDLDVYLQQ